MTASPSVRQFALRPPARGNVAGMRTLVQSGAASRPDVRRRGLAFLTTPRFADRLRKNRCPLDRGSGKNPAFGRVRIGQKPLGKARLLPIRCPSAAENKPGYHDTTANM